MQLNSILTRTAAAAGLLLTLPSLASAQAAGANGQLIQMVIMFGGIGLVMYLFMIRPQQRRAREQREMIENSQAGDNLMLNSGFKVKLKHKDERFFRVEMSEGVIVEVDPAAVNMNVTALEKRADEAKEKADAKKAARNKNN
jgi:preprotein translocase subunit YajC